LASGLCSQTSTSARHFWSIVQTRRRCWWNKSLDARSQHSPSATLGSLLLSESHLPILVDSTASHVLGWSVSLLNSGGWLELDRSWYGLTTVIAISCTFKCHNLCQVVIPQRWITSLCESNPSLPFKWYTTLYSILWQC
jgi:hypothetical protein